MDSFSKFMDQIKAEDDLKERTKAYVKKELVQRDSIGRTARRKVLAAAFTFTFFAVFTVSGYALYQHPVNYICLDINPSVELKVNIFDVVIEAQGVNDDGKALIADKKIRRMSIQDAAGTLVKEASDRKYIADDGSTVIAVTAESKDAEKALALKDKSVNGIRDALKSCKMEAIVYADSMDLEMRAKAIELDLSPGKYKILRILQTLNQDMDITRYKDARVSEIIVKAKGMLDTGGYSKGDGIYEENFDQIRNIGLRLQEISGTDQQTTNTNMIRNNGEEEQMNEKQQEQEQNTQRAGQTSNGGQTTDSGATTAGGDSGKTAETSGSGMTSGPESTGGQGSNSGNGP